MPFNISKSLVKKLPTEERDEPESVGKFLLDRQASVCWLCDGKMTVASEILEADHNVPEAEGGITALSNLHLAHQECNRSKKNLSTAQIKPYLRLRRYIREHGGRLKYGELTPLFGISPQPSEISMDGDVLTITFANGQTEQAPIYTEQVQNRVWQYAFIRTPRVGIMNDKSVQPRNVRYDHCFQIYGDLLRNPLHEPPSCRIGNPDKNGLSSLLMFDGQHKTIATWMMQRESVVVKLYLNMSVTDANFLVNSIQSKIKKLPLSQFELASKMSDEWRNKVDKYETEMSAAGKEASEEGYIKWVPAGTERNRANSAFKAALIQKALDHQDFRVVQYVNAGSAPQTGEASVTETMVKKKILDKMIMTTPLKEPFHDSTNRRDEETENTVWMWNMVVDELAAPAPQGEELTDNQKEARRRLFKQEALEHVSQLLAQLFRQVMMKDAGELMLDGQPTEGQRDQIEKGILLITKHPVWTAPLDRDEKMLGVADALSRNQGGKEAFESVALKLSYALLGHADIEFKSCWT